VFYISLNAQKAISETSLCIVTDNRINLVPVSMQWARQST